MDGRIVVSGESADIYAVAEVLLELRATVPITFTVTTSCTDSRKGGGGRAGLSKGPEKGEGLRRTREVAASLESIRRLPAEKRVHEQSQDDAVKKPKGPA